MNIRRFRRILFNNVYNCNLIGGFQNTRTNNEDFALTPYLFMVRTHGETIKIRGVGLCWGYYSVIIGLGWGIPIFYPKFIIIKKQND